jgi:hypothetical protein
LELSSGQSADQSIDPSGRRTQYVVGASALTKTQYRNADGEVWHRAAGAINRNLPTMRPDSSKIVAWITTNHALSPARFALARKNSGEEDRALPKKQPGGDPMQSKAQIDQILRQKSDAVEIPGVVAVAANGSDVIYQGAFGKRDLSKPDAMTACSGSPR